MLIVIAGIAVAFFVFRALGAPRSGGILRRAFWCCYVLWAALVVYGLAFTASTVEWGWLIGFLAVPLVLYGMVVFIVRGKL